MWLGVIMVTVTGLLWTMVGVVMSETARKSLQAWDIMRISATFSLLCGLVFLLFDRGALNIDTTVLSKVVLSLGAAGAANVIGILCMQRAMQKGHHGTVWIICQSALIVPFLMGVLYFNERVTFTRIFGLVAILVSMIAFGTQKQDTGSKYTSKAKWLLPAMAAFLLFGTNQCLANLPSYWKLPNLSAILRALLFQCGAICVFSMMSAVKRMKPQKSSIKPALTLTMTAMIGQYLLFYQGLDKLAKAGIGSIGFPLTVGACIVGFSCYSIFIIKEKTTLTQYLGLALGIIGIITISF